ncbi:4'-phosphopantetheinyl transferase superfamily protein [Duganella sp. FT94W]|uniref:4'-phosphopantetheinyl transferase superfamily protein n=1 Tax=Duganella lactea TaxID=2692173 RepID=A0ABW9V1E1_9BURK|nr:4'-phosphopantetheinyl transferase superfamily protein [Duganella lactea]MYM33554.1 4'-phosphopantetheinyl transferase superfamily protein [Duganella lactea]
MKSLAVHMWLGPTPAPQDGLFAILIHTDGGPHRDAARRQLRLAAREVLAAVLHVPPDDIGIVSRPGEAPSVVLAGAPTVIGISFSHDERYSLAAINLQGRIGADIQLVQDIPDWQAVARDYLGPAVAAALQATPAAERPAAFTQAWTQREAALKCHAQQLSEWQGDLPGQAISLILPVAGLTGHLYIGDNNA